ncbi:PC-esterase domain-containing protein 1A-like [Osmerus mordax]|uniref:PC-esterase domain-containing protein 1A-like n=1 Tax=Osmerus mordax TaxID=8014 RepID=UPI003510142A
MLINHGQASDLLRKKCVIVLGDSIQRSVYKDLVVLLQKDNLLTVAQLKKKGEMEFEHDCLLEGGIMNNSTGYREVREYRSDNHHVRFYFITRIFSEYVESILEDIRCGLKPDLVVVNSCIWDISRHNRPWELDYMNNLKQFFKQLKSVLPKESLVIWTLTMPVGNNIRGGFLVPEIAHMGSTLREDIVEANSVSRSVASGFGLDVLDLHNHFCSQLQHRTKDNVHWNAQAHRQISTLLLQHTAQAWGVALPGLQTVLDLQDGPKQNPVCESHTMTSGLVALRPAPAHRRKNNYIITKYRAAKLKWQCQFKLESRRKYRMYTMYNKYTKKN